MPIQTQTVRFGPDLKYSGLLATPFHPVEARPLPAVLLIQEAWGVDGHIQDLAHRFAGAGYVVLAPDLFAEGGVRRKGLEPDRVEEAKNFMDSLPSGAWMDPERRKQALDATEAAKAARVSGTMDTIFGGIQKDRDFHIAAIESAAAWLRKDNEATRGGLLASVGFCMGGSLSGQLAARDPALAGAVIFYGQAPEPGQAASLACPVLGLYGENDPRTNASVAPFEGAMRAAGKDVEIHMLTGAGHAFLNDTRPSFHAAAAREATARTLGFLNKVLG
ncbi:MAG TPA: dienelactone hydrolase family protein [bacterium]|jgi:carboxymethylenebutenolidase|nr:dienelactone hydrolase family protein [bacterium]